MDRSFVPSTLVEILRDLFLAERSGILSLCRTEVRKRIFFDRGMIHFADSSLEDERLLDFLIHSRVLDPGEATRLRALAADDPSLARKLKEAGRIPEERLSLVTRELIQQVVQSTLRWDSGESSFMDVPPGGSDAFPTDVIVTFGFLMRGIQTMSGFGPIREAMLRLDRPVKLSPDLFLPLEKLALHPIQGFALSRVDGSTRIREIASLIPPSEEDNAMRFLFGLLLLGIIQTLPPLSAGALSVKDLLSGDRELRERADREAVVIREMCRTVAQEAPWQVLGLAPSAGVEEVRKAYENRRDAFRPERFMKKTQDTFREELMLIEAKLLEAYLGMAQDQMNSARNVSPSPGSVTLDMDTMSKRKELTKTHAQEFLEEQNRRAEQFYLKAREFFKAKDYYNSIQYCEQALKGNDSDARFHSLLGQALLRNPDYRWQKRAEKCLLRAAEIDPWNVEHFILLGNFYRSHNLLRKAKKSFMKAAEVMPSHPEALRALAEMRNVEA